MSTTGWLLSPSERGNDATVVDRRHTDGLAWTAGNRVQPLVHGATYLPRLAGCIEGMRPGDLLLFTDWRGDPDERIDEHGRDVGTVLSAAARRGVVVRGLLWRSHLDKLAFSEQENRHLGEEIQAAGGQCLLDMRVRPGGSHHQKVVVLRHAGRPELDVAFVGGIDLCHSRLDDREHDGDPQRQPMAAAYGPRPPWHDIQLEVHGPAVGDIEASFRERWEDPAPLSRNPLHRLADRVRGDDKGSRHLPPQEPDPDPCGTQTVQVLRTYPARRRGYPFAPDGERSIARAYRKAVGAARSIVYLEDQYLWGREVIACFAEAMRASPELRFVAVVPRLPDQDGRLSTAPHLAGRLEALEALRRAGGDRLAVYSVENLAGTPIYVHAKACVVDDVWFAVGSDNVNRRSWTHDSELSCAVLDEELDPRRPEVLDRFGDGARVLARDLRLTLAREHLERADGDDEDLVDPVSMFEVFAESADRLERWYDGGRRGPRPRGRLRPYRTPAQPRRTSVWAEPTYRTVFDPDGRPRGMRRAGTF